MGAKYITPTKENPVFTGQNMYTGEFIPSAYKGWEVKNDKQWIIGDTMALSFTDAIEQIHEYIKENHEYNPPNTKFQIEMIDGSVNKYGDPIRVPVYKISMRQAKRFKLI